MGQEKNDGVLASPISLRAFLRSPWSAVCLLLFIFIIYKSISSYEQHKLIRDFQGAYHLGASSWFWSTKIDSTDQVIFPQTFGDEDLGQFLEKNKLSDSLLQSKLIKFSSHISAEARLRHALKPSEFKDHEVNVFHSSSNINLDLEKCEPKLQEKFSVQVDKPKGINVSLKAVLTQLLSDLKSNPYLSELSDFFIDELALQIKYNVVEHYWYRLAGSSVYLEDYGVHFMISRILYSPKGARNQPIISLTYAQIFDEEWNELTNTKLVLPDNENGFKVMEFPSFLPIPFWFDVDNTEGKFYGPEDPRIMLVKNQHGHEEPLIVFNAYHRKMEHFDDDADDHLILKPGYYRSMFMCWPWQTQKGKENTDGLPSDDYKDSIYSKVVELHIRNAERRSKQKNWTPFVSLDGRAADGFDTHVNFIYRWANLEVLKCEMATGQCSFTYRLNNRLSTSAKVGPLRGGTQLINVKHLLGTQKGIDVDSIIPPNREIWLGFARAHLDKCGCGNVMYRPNMVILVKDKVGEKQLFRLSHVSSSISFDIPMIGWDLNNSKDLCHGTNVLIPNGISSWVLSHIGESGGHFTADDDMSLSLSISDFTVHKINIRGLLNHVFAMEHDSLFLKPGEQDQSKIDNKRLLIPNPKIVNDPTKIDSHWLIGFNNDNVVCAMSASRDFCAAYGLEQEKIFSSEYGYEFELEDEEFLEQQDSAALDKYEHELGMHHFDETFNDRLKEHLGLPPLRQHNPGGVYGGGRTHGMSHVPSNDNLDDDLINEYAKVDPEKLGSTFNGTIFADDEETYDDEAEADAKTHRNSTTSYSHYTKPQKAPASKGPTKLQRKPAYKNPDYDITYDDEELAEDTGVGANKKVGLAETGEKQRKKISMQKAGSKKKILSEVEEGEEDILDGNVKLTGIKPIKQSPKKPTKVPSKNDKVSKPPAKKKTNVDTKNKKTKSNAKSSKLKPKAQEY